MSNEENDTIYELKYPVTQLNIDVRAGEDGPVGIPGPVGPMGQDGIDPNHVLGTVGDSGPTGVEGPPGIDGGPCEPGPAGTEPTQTVEINYAVAEEPPQPALGDSPSPPNSTDDRIGDFTGGGAATTVPGLHIAAARAHGSATLHAREFGCGVITITYDVSGAYRIHSEGINITYVIGFLQRAIMSLEASTRDRSPFAG